MVGFFAWLRETFVSEPDGVVPRGVAHPQGYELTVTPQGIHIVASRPAGAFYAALTLAQMIESADHSDPQGVGLRAARVRDWPDFATRGVMLDVSRDRVPTMDTLYRLLDLLAGWKINHVQLYTEHTFAYRNHPEVWAEASPFTGEEILALDAYCRERFIELVPNQNSFGHMHRWLKHERHAALAETTGWFDTPRGMRRQGPFGLCPLDPGSLDLVRGLFDELLPHFRSRLFNIGGDETIDLGQGRSKEACEQLGAGRHLPVGHDDCRPNRRRDHPQSGRTCASRPPRRPAQEPAVRRRELGYRETPRRQVGAGRTGKGRSARGRASDDRQPIQ